MLAEFRMHPAHELVEMSALRACGLRTCSEAKNRSISNVLPRPTPPQRYSPRGPVLPRRAGGHGSHERTRLKERRAVGATDFRSSSQARGRLLLCRVELQPVGGHLSRKRALTVVRSTLVTKP